MHQDPRQFLGAGPAFPFRIGAEGLPFLEFVEGPASVRSAIAFLLRTAEGDLPFDPGLGLDPEVFRFDPLDERLVAEVRQRIGTSLVAIEPRIENAVATVETRPRDRELRIDIDYDLVDSFSEDNEVALPLGGHEDILRTSTATRLPQTGFTDPSLQG